MSYAGLISAAQRLIQEKGTACKWNQAQQTTIPGQPWEEISGIDIQHDTYIVLLPFDSVLRRMFGYADGRALPAGVVVGYVPGSEDFTPALRDTVLVDSKTYTVAAMDVINPNADKDIVYVVELHQ